ncbi:MAG: type II 3-dehydroquinate dehydratase [Sodaliphilus pleomorphus]|jgi:3-dehydroquinate dehydratase-2|uniref:3-dehydroquinate dehydratase n=1 Tax=Sodaliphilus pleomorphus TaxID=2606626 RepID=A0A6L5XEC3_9BACT|nr:type II 3-dehydroquinate dehydratase [Sodaliphilus pleomorphus]MDD7067100.1 3-dehydroquinate dehydratase [Sodaliphilus pleomorphus]MDY2832003.1 type II 3-dehydroquinate dehydratase [Sodaliphilus pleomorphus]MSS17708.1 3-dehydroquinate dehydratase [Sodaliphilus pleomorphus]
MKISIINGPNLNLVGVREPEIYGHRSLSEYLDNLVGLYPGVDFDLFQSNHEGAIIDEIQRVGFDHDGIVLNAGAYTHYSIAIADALRAVTAPAIEVHISDTQAREPYRHVSMIKEACVAVIAGYGLDSYRRAVDCLLEMKNTAKP